MAYCLDKGKVKVLFTGDSIPAKGDLPIFTDSGKSKETIQKIRRMQGIDFIVLPGIGCMQATKYLLSWIAHFI